MGSEFFEPELRPASNPNVRQARARALCVSPRRFARSVSVGVCLCVFKQWRGGTMRPFDRLSFDVWTSTIHQQVWRARMRRRPGEVRDAIVEVLEGRSGGASLQEITSEVVTLIGDVPPSSVRSYPRLNTPALFCRTDRAQYVLTALEESHRPPEQQHEAAPASFRFGRAQPMGPTAADAF